MQDHTLGQLLVLIKIVLISTRTHPRNLLKFTYGNLWAVYFIHLGDPFHHAVGITPGGNKNAKDLKAVKP